jgi:hypothetical protein
MHLASKVTYLQLMELVVTLQAVSRFCKARQANRPTAFACFIDKVFTTGETTIRQHQLSFVVESITGKSVETYSKKLYW